MAIQEHLAELLKQEKEDEDARIKRAIEEQEAKTIKEEKEKEEKHRKRMKEIEEHRKEQVTIDDIGYGLYAKHFKIGLCCAFYM